MSTTYKQLIDGTYVTAAISTGYTVPTSVTSQIHRLTFSNSHTAQVTVTVYLVGSGDTVSNAKLIANAHPLGAKETWSCPDAEGQVLEAGGTLQFIASTTNVVGCRCSGVEITAS